MRNDDYMQPWDGEGSWGAAGISFLAGLAIAIMSLLVGFMLGRVM